MARDVNYRDADCFIAKSGSNSLGWRHTLIEAVQLAEAQTDDPTTVVIDWMVADGAGGSVPRTDFAMPDKTVWRPKLSGIVGRATAVPNGTMWIVERTDNGSRMWWGSNLSGVLKKLSDQLRGDERPNGRWGLMAEEKELIQVYGLQPEGTSIHLDHHEFFEKADLWRWKTEDELTTMLAEKLLVQNTKGI